MALLSLMITAGLGVIPAAAQAGTTASGAAPSSAAVLHGKAAITAADYNNVALVNQWTTHATAKAQCADLPGFGVDPINSPVNQYPCTANASSDNQQWNVHLTRVVNNGKLGLYEIINVKSGLCLDPPGYGSDPAGTHLATYYCNANPANDNQEWYFFDATGNSDYAFVNYQDNLCLDVSGWASNGTDLAPNLPLTLYPCYNSSWANGGYDDHLWDVFNT
jgi:hypothetical protein